MSQGNINRGQENHNSWNVRKGFTVKGLRNSENKVFNFANLFGLRRGIKREAGRRFYGSPEETRTPSELKLAKPNDSRERVAII